MKVKTLKGIVIDGRPVAKGAVVEVSDLEYRAIAPFVLRVDEPVVESIEDAPKPSRRRRK